MYILYSYTSLIQVVNKSQPSRYLVLYKYYTSLIQAVYKSYKSRIQDVYKSYTRRIQVLYKSYTPLIYVVFPCLLLYPTPCLSFVILIDLFTWQRIEAFSKCLFIVKLWHGICHMQLNLEMMWVQRNEFNSIRIGVPTAVAFAAASSAASAVAFSIVEPQH